MRPISEKRGCQRAFAARTTPIAFLWPWLASVKRCQSALAPHGVMSATGAGVSADIGPVSSRSDGYATTRIGLRAPRVAIVFDGGAHWHYWARLALHVATNTWGGSGFIVIPHVDGEVHVDLLQLVRAYDPDYVALLQPTIGEYEAAQPGELPFILDGQKLDGEAREELLAQVRDQIVNLPAGETARAQVSAACSPHRRRLGDEDRWMEDLTHVRTTDKPGRSLTAVAELDPAPMACLSVPPTWGGLLGVAASARCGMRAKPIPSTDPDLDEQDHLAAVRWLINRDALWARPPQALLLGPGTETTELSKVPTALATTERGLTWVKGGFLPDESMLLVLGDTATDFALATGWDRMYGNAIWLPQSWSPDVSSAVGTPIAHMLQNVVEERRFKHSQVHVYSTSAESGQVDALIHGVRKPDVHFIGDDGSPDLSGPSYEETVVPGRLRFPARGALHLAVADQYDQQFALPVTNDDRGGFVMATPGPPPVITQPDLAGSEVLQWQVDVDFAPPVMPRGRALSGQSLLAPDEDLYLTWVRSGRDGISYESHRYNFVLAGTPLVSRLARPRLRQLGLLDWTRALAEQEAVSVALSQAGRRVEILRRLIGSRQRLAESFSGPLLPALRAFRPNGRTTSSAYPDHGGVLLGVGQGYLTFGGIRARVASSLSDADLRAQLDILLSTRILRRGTVLDCAECEQPSFIAVDQLAQVNVCIRCGSPNELAQPRWRHPPEEPTWFYDLHPAARELLGDNGEVPLLLSHHLRTKSRVYDDIAEIEATRTGASKPFAETDLVSICDDEVIVAEAKSNSDLGRNASEIRRAAAKRVLFASLVQAQQLVLATTQAGWRQTSLTAISTAVTEHHWMAGPPTLRVIAGLGSGSVSDERLDLETGTRTTW